LKKIKQTFHVSDMIEQMFIYSHMMEDQYEFDDEVLEKATKLGLILFAGYPPEYFLPEEKKFLNEFMNKISKYADRNGGYNEFQ
jgi:hypothetical protein